EISSREFACICKIRPTRSRLSFTEFLTYEPESNVPEYTRKNVNLPTYGSDITLNASAENGSLSPALRITSSSVSGTIPSIAATSVGAGRYSITPSSNNCTPLFLNADPQNTG